MGSSDITGVNIIAFRQINQFDLSGNIQTLPEHLATLSVGEPAVPRPPHTGFYYTLYVDM